MGKRQSRAISELRQILRRDQGCGAPVLVLPLQSREHCRILCVITQQRDSAARRDQEFALQLLKVPQVGIVLIDRGNPIRVKK